MAGTSLSHQGSSDCGVPAGGMGSRAGAGAGSNCGTAAPTAVGLFLHGSLHASSRGGNKRLNDAGRHGGGRCPDDDSSSELHGFTHLRWSRGGGEAAGVLVSRCGGDRDRKRLCSLAKARGGHRR